MAVTAIPPAATWPASLSEPADGSGWYAVYAGRREVEYNAACLWFGHWLDQQENGTTASRAAALEAVLQMRAWKTFSDPMINGSIDYFDGLLRAAESGDLVPIRAELATNCSQ